MKSAEIRRQFIDFFTERGHREVPSSSLVPGNDPTLLFTNAGMVQFKDCFLGLDKRDYNRAVTSQRCVRAGGKHNDLENVGYTARHHTFFEMLGNFSFGDYFKQDAIHYCWEFLTEVLQLPKAKLWVTVYEEDQEAFDIWVNEIGFPAERISRIGDNKGGRYASDNFWQMGDTGPCGPCSEVFYDHGEHIWGGPPGTPEEDGDRFIEIWNLVFMQFERAANGEMTPLPKPSVDTGMGLERLSAILQNGHSNYDIDLFQTLLNAVAGLAGMPKGSDDASLKVVADHIRSCAFLIVDGVLPSNEGRGYVLRRIIRRAIRHGHKLGLKGPFFHKLVAPLVDEMGAAYPELSKAQALVESELEKEERRFAETLDQGLKILEARIEEMNGDTIDGATLFKLYDTYGFPLDLTADIARERALQIDEAGFEKLMNAQRERARAAGKFGTATQHKIDIDTPTDFLGYKQLEGAAQIQGIYVDGASVDSLQTGGEALIVLDQTPFYAESGGQVGDMGLLQAAGAEFQVQDTQKQGDTFIHAGTMLSGEFAVGTTVSASVEQDRRHAIVLNHSATHLMHEALRQVLGDHVEQKGSIVMPERLRFDFSHPEPVTPEQLRAVEELVNSEIRRNQDSQADYMDMDAAKAAGARALFGEKYGDVVRVMRIGYSTELCGGCHVERSGDIGLFKIVSEGGIAAGIRRVEAITGAAAIAWLHDTQSQLDTMAGILKAPAHELTQKAEQLLVQNRALEKSLTQLKGQLASAAGADLASQAIEVAGIKLLAAELAGADPKSLRDTCDELKHKLGEAIVVLATVQDEKISLVAGISKALTDRYKAGDLVRYLAEQVGGKGGGRPDMAQGGGSDVAALPVALDSVAAWVEGQR